MLQNRLAISSISLGQHANHTLPRKVTAAAEAGMQGIEIIYPDLEEYANISSITMLEAADVIRQQCQESGLEIIAFASFQNFEGQRSPLSERLQTAQHWLTLAIALGAAHLQMPSNYDRSANGDRSVIIPELRQLCDLAKTMSSSIKIANENLAWGTHCDLWQQALQTVQDVDRDNFGLCLDSFHLCVTLWADPFSRSGIQPDGKRKLQESLRELPEGLPLDKLFYLQLSDGELLDPPYSESHPWYDPTLQPGHVWSNEARPFPFESNFGTYMPVLEVARAFLVDLGFTGWVSLETFDRRMRVEEQGPAKNARRAVESWKLLGDELSNSQSRLAKL
ncbi:hypothetical protein B9Z65_2005 [Elsinoe australis]|uniref:Xylose isomerase-like TIM barrel domain-containing protein n=1 Tax=Elsinoe australis TaxID=40998 RepID=A0A2P7YMT2_9PEZI|nr:hypothetical protein B9Z65_2005 [Elsinoe australis]